MKSANHTHKVAVNAFLLHQDHFLLLKRKTEPFIWGPAGGRLNPDEDPIDGLKREVQEETGLDIIVHLPVTTWFGEFNHSKLLAIDYLCTCFERTVILSAEHSDFRWLTIEALAAQPESYFHDHIGFGLSDFEQAWKQYLLTQKKTEQLSNLLKVDLSKKQ